MKQFRLLNSEDGIIADEVDGRTCKYCSSAFIYKDEQNIYHLVDKETGLAICHAKKLIDLELNFMGRKKAYEEYKKSDTYKIKAERFDKLKLAFNYKGVK